MIDEPARCEFGYSHGVYSDGWTGSEAYIELPGCAEAQVHFFLPRNPDALPSKTLTIFDGKSCHVLIIERGGFGILDLKAHRYGLVAFQLYCDQVEPVTEADARSLGVLVSLIQSGSAKIAVSSRPDVARIIPAQDFHPDYRAVAPLFDPAFFLSFFSAEMAPRDPLLHYLTAGWREGREPAAWFSTPELHAKHPELVGENDIPLVKYLALQNSAVPVLDAQCSDTSGHKGDPDDRPGNVGSDQLGADDLAGIADAGPASPPSGTHGFVEGGFVSAGVPGGIVYGWALHSPDGDVWLEDEHGARTPLGKGYRWNRDDVRQAFPDSPWRTSSSGFLVYVPTLTKDSRITLRLRCKKGIANLGERSGAVVLPSQPKAVAERLFGLETPVETMHARTAAVDWPFLAALTTSEAAMSNAPQILRHDFGSACPDPAISIIVPLYGRFDFLEHQLLEFAQDYFIRDNCEIIYVVDDPQIPMATLALAEETSKLIGVAISVVHYGGNLGFSGANNAGASVAHAPVLLFLNSDVIPQRAGWAAALHNTLISTPNAGAVGPRLVFADGGIQHAGMTFEFNQAFGIWTNQHRLMGLDPVLDEGPTVQDVPAVTGACVMLTRDMFDAIGGWDTGYLIGDFEDSHLCLAIRAQGKRVLYDRSVQLVHLERQSFKSLGSAEFRQKVVIANASRHQSLWGQMMSAEVQ